MQLLVHTPMQYDAVSFYRTVGPLNQLRKDYPTLQVKYAKTISWIEHSGAHVLYAQRPFRGEDVKVIGYAKQCGAKVWVDYDDNLFEVGSNNKAHIIYNAPGVAENIKKICSIADIITTSTEDLKGVYGGHEVIPNAYPDYLEDYLDTEAAKEHKIIWRGSDTHNKDMLNVTPEILKFMNNYPFIKWHFIGWNPWFITQQAPKGVCRYMKTVDCVQLYAMLHKTNASIAVVPLEVDKFNRGKSNIAWLEHMAGGAITIAPGMPEWDQPGIVMYDNDCFYDALEYSVNMDYNERKNIVASGQEYIKSKLLLSKVNKKRIAILNKFGYRI